MLLEEISKLSAKWSAESKQDTNRALDPSPCEIPRLCRVRHFIWSKSSLFRQVQFHIHSSRLHSFISCSRARNTLFSLFSQIKSIHHYLNGERDREEEKIRERERERERERGRGRERERKRERERERKRRWKRGQTEMDLIGGRTLEREEKCPFSDRKFVSGPWWWTSRWNGCNARTNVAL